MKLVLEVLEDAALGLAIAVLATSSLYLAFRFVDLVCRLVSDMDSGSTIWSM